MKLISINIEGNRHLERIIPFIEKEQPDVICLQEVFRSEKGILEFPDYEYFFLPMTKKFVNDVEVEMGIAIYTHYPARFETLYYHKFTPDLQFFDPKNKSDTEHRGVVVAHIDYGGAPYTIATTHFTWTPRGENPDEMQRSDLWAFFECMRSVPPHIICGDFNIPRTESPLYPEIIQTYTDNIPLSYASSLDKNFHHLGVDSTKSLLLDSFMVDYIFSQPPYIVSDVRLEFGISDHAAVVATINRTP